MRIYRLRRSIAIQTTLRETYARAGSSDAARECACCIETQERELAQLIEAVEPPSSTTSGENAAPCTAR